MKEALIVLTLLGCDDTGARCHYLSVATQRFETAAQCSSASDRLLRNGVLALTDGTLRIAGSVIRLFAAETDQGLRLLPFSEVALRKEK